MSLHAVHIIVHGIASHALEFVQCYGLTVLFPMRPNSQHVYLVLSISSYIDAFVVVYGDGRPNTFPMLHDI